MRTRSAPARIAATAAAGTSERAVTAAASIESVMITPRKPKRSRSSPVRMRGDWEAIRPPSSAG